MQTRINIANLILICALTTSVQAQLQINPTTTRTIETSNNTPASVRFTDQYLNPHAATYQSGRVVVPLAGVPDGAILTATGTSGTLTMLTNGDALAGNVSDQKIGSWLGVPGVRVFAETQSWFCHNVSDELADGSIDPKSSLSDAKGNGGQCHGHIDIGYDSQTSVAAQFDAMIARGISGAFFNWNNNAWDDAIANAMMSAAQARPGFVFGIMIDKNALKSCVPTTSNPTPPSCTTVAISATQKVMGTWATKSSSYAATPDGRPIIMYFVDTGTSPKSTSVNWDSVRANSGGNPVLLGDGGGLDGNGNPTGALSAGIHYDGAFSWVAPSDGRNGLLALSNFYTAAAKSGKIAVGGMWRGFDDKVAFAWRGGRIADTQCGKLWISTKNATHDYGVQHPMSMVLLSTWDDYEEGSEMESGIDNCMQPFGGGMQGNFVTWTPQFGTDPYNSAISGDETTIDHYTVFISTDGENLMPLPGNVASGTHQLDLSQYGVGPGQYTLYVKAVGIPGVQNHVSDPIPFTVSGNSCLVSISSPQNGATVGASVPISATGTPAPGASMTSMSILVDGVQIAQVAAASISTTAALSQGTHTITVEGSDSTGNSCSSTISVSVPPSGTNPPVVTVSTPANNSTVNSPVSIVASASSDQAITGWHIYVDGVDSFGAGQVGSINASVPMRAGKHTVIVRAWDAGGQFGDQTLSLTVPGVTVEVTAPAAGATVSSPVLFTANATSALTITAWHIYIDSIDKFTGGQTASISTSLDLSSGTHTAVVRAWDSSGAFGDQTVQFTVAGVRVTVSAPQDNASVSSPVPITASATSGNTITGWHIYVDTVDSFSAGQTNSINASVVVTRGTHTIIVRAWDSSGASGDVTLTVNVAGVTVNVTTPGSGDLVSSPVAIAANATSGHPITGWHIYVDNTDSFSAGQASSINASIPMSNGTHTVIVRAWDSTGANADQTLTVNVTGVTVNVTSPTGTNVGSPVSIAANATSGNPITGWHIYVDNVDSFSGGQVGSISASIPMSAGTHNVIVRAWDSSGDSGDQTLTLNVTNIAVNVTSPANNATVASPVSIAANATSGHVVTAWHIYVDSVDSFSAGQVNSIHPSIPMSSGRRTVIVRAWDSSGAFADQTLTLTVQ